MRQGDPLSLYLFLLCMERLSYLIVKEVQEGNWKAIWLGRDGPCISHVFLGDELVLFAKATIDQVELIEKVLRDFVTLQAKK